MKKFTTLALVSVLVGAGSLKAQQNVGIGTTTPDASARLDIASSNKGLLIPRVSLSSLNDATTIATPATGLMVYNTNAALQGGVGFYYNSGTAAQAAWVRFQTGNGGSGSGWSLTGNAGTSGDFNFIGTTDNQPLVFKVNNIYAGQIGNGGLIAIGRGAVESEKTNAPGVISIGDSSLFSNTLDSSEIAIGNGALFSQATPGQGDNIAIGNFALVGSTLGAMNTAVGMFSLQSVDDSSNTAVGYGAANGSTGWENTAVGSLALGFDQAGVANTAFGYEANASNSTGFYNVAVGHVALLNNTSGNRNTAIGRGSMPNDTSGLRNTGVGYFTLVNLLTGNRNVAVGAYAGRTISSGNNNIAIGDSAATISATVNNTIAIGTGTLVDQSNRAIIGNLSTTSIGGPVNWSVLSDGRYKKDVAENVKGLDFILKLRPVTYSYDYAKIEGQNRNALAGVEGITAYKTSFSSKTPGRLANAFSKAGKGTLSDMHPSGGPVLDNPNEGVRFTGFIAQEVEAAAKSIGFDFSGVDKPTNTNSKYALRYAEFVVPLVKAVQEQQAIIEAQNKKIETLIQRIEKLEAQK